MPTITLTTLPFACAQDNCERNGIVELIEVDEGHAPMCLACKGRMMPVRPPSTDVLPEPPRAA